MAEVIGVRFKEVGKVYYFDPNNKKLNLGDTVIVETARGVECGVIAMENKVVNDDEIVIILADTGPGIPNVELAMQEGYSTARDNIRALGFGAGMGLPNMKKYTDEMKIDTEVGVGTTITMKVYL